MTFPSLSVVTIVIVAGLLPRSSWQAETYCDNNCQPATVSGYFCVASNPAMFTRCVSGVRYNFTCATGTVFNSKTNVCDWPSNVTPCSCSTSSTTTASTTTTKAASTKTTKAPSTTSSSISSTTTTKLSTATSSTTASTTTTTSNGGSTSKVVMCYYTNWAQYRSGSAKFLPENIDATLCTHIIYAFLTFDTTTMKLLEWNDDQMIPRVLALKSANPNLKVLASIGGWNAGTSTFSSIIADSTTMNNWNRNALAFVRQYNFDGIDIDFEYPAARGSPAADKTRFTAWMQALRTAINSETIPAGKSKLLLTIAIGAGIATIDNGYELGPVSTACDYVNVMTYDFHGSWDGYTGFNAPLNSKSSWTGTSLTQMTTSYAINYLIQKGAIASKLVMGIPLYGRSYTLASASSNGIGAATTGAGTQGKYTLEAGFNSFYETCMMRKCSSTSYTYVSDSETKSPYMYYGTSWISPEDPTSVGAKTSYALQKGLAGVMFWALDLDDFNDMCQTGVKYPLVKSVVNVLKGGSPVQLDFSSKSSTFC